MNERTLFQRELRELLTFPPKVISIPESRRIRILRGAGWRKTDVIVALRDFNGAPLAGNLVLAEFKSLGVAPGTEGRDVAGGVISWSGVWLKPTGTARVMAIARPPRRGDVQGVTYYTRRQNIPFRLEGNQQHEEVTVKASSGETAGYKVGAKGTAGLDFKVYKVGGEVSGARTGTTTSSQEVTWKVVLPGSAFDLKQI
jgi:hypothetical protein